MWMVAAYRWTHRPSWLAWFEVGSHVKLSLYSSNERRELSQWPGQDDSTIIVAGISRPHRSTSYVDATYCYRASSVAVCRTVCRSVTVVRREKTAEPIDMRFGLWARMGRSNHVLDGERGKGGQL